MPNGERNSLICFGWVFEPFSPDALRLPFDCGDDDLNEFYNQDLVTHEEQLMTKSYLLYPEGTRLSKRNPPVAFISYCNDAVQKQRFQSEEAQKSLEELPESKRYPSLPAVKIARLGVQSHSQSQGAGSFLLNLSKALFRSNNRTGCRFLTVDAYRNERTVNFYRKNQFQFLTDKDALKDHRTMFYDLKRTPDSEIEQFRTGFCIHSLF